MRKCSRGPHGGLAIVGSVKIEADDRAALGRLLGYISFEPHEVRLAVLVARYTTPLAIILVCLGIFLSQPANAAFIVLVSLLANELAADRP